ncbi:MAG: polysaccharide deacetylase family protein [Clostridia bacterium]|nr:polysaccharide deacetylase family protein [Clostridia bacterium]
MKKSMLIFALAAVIMLSGCTGRNTLEETDANAPVTVEDIRTTAETSRAENAGMTSALTGRRILPPASFKANDPDNSRNLSTKRIEHSYGVAKNSMPHQISVDNQKYFEATGYKAVCYDTKSSEKVLYLTFDCGWENGYTSKCLDVLKEKKVPAAFFCTLDHIESTPDLIARMINEGHIVGNHSASHADFTEISRQKMADELLECDNYLRKNFGYATSFFRFPEGAYNENSLELIDSMGYTSVFWSCAYADWDVNAAKGGDYAFETVTARLHPGAIILLHSVSPDNAEALGRIIDFARQNGYEFKALTEYKF